MFSLQSIIRARALPPRDKAVLSVAFAALPLRAAGGFLLGASCAALIVLTFAGAGLALSRTSVDARGPALNEFSLHRLPRPSLSLGPIA